MQALLIDTAAPMRDACLDCGVHYLDITGEINVLADGLAKHEEAQAKGVAFISGVGFDVVPTDVLAVKLREYFPEANHLELAFAGTHRKAPAISDDLVGSANHSDSTPGLVIEHDDGSEVTIDVNQANNSDTAPDEVPGGISPGTSKTMLRMLPDLGWVRRSGELVQVPLAAEQKWFQFDDKRRHCMSIPWGDVETAYASAGFENITVFTEAAPEQAQWTRRISPIAGVFRWAWVQKLADKLIDKYIQGPDFDTRQEAQMTLVGVASDDQSKSKTLLARCDEGYDFTVTSSLYFVESLLAHKILPGAYTPTQAVDVDILIDMLGIDISMVTDLTMETQKG